MRTVDRLLSVSTLSQISRAMGFSEDAVDHALAGAPTEPVLARSLARLALGRGMPSTYAYVSNPGRKPSTPWGILAANWGGPESLARLLGVAAVTLSSRWRLSLPGHAVPRVEEAIAGAGLGERLEVRVNSNGSRTLEFRG